VSLCGSCYVAAGALDAYGTALAVVGNNIANLNTVGFKAARPEFADIVAAAADGSNAGMGVRGPIVSRPFLQGQIVAGEAGTDLAVEGAGLFVLRSGSGATFYSRAGQFALDAGGRLVNAAGLAVQGLAGGGLADIVIDRTLSLPPAATGTIRLAGNLDASTSAPPSAMPADAPGSEATPALWFEAANFSARASIFDSLGRPHDLTLVFRKTAAPNRWEYRVLADGAEIAGGSAGLLRQVSGSGGLLAFNADGTLDTAASVFSPIGPISWANGAGPQAIASDLAAFTQFSFPSALAAAAQDGSPQASLAGVRVDRSGTLTGEFSDGRTLALARIALANFANVEGLEPLGETLFAESALSGPAAIGSPGSGGLGAIAPGSLEGSSVDLAAEIVGLIQFQRAFQVNARVIAVAERMYEEAANLKA
jgi:flagellar hook protein FlgE